ncbi:MAG: type secretion system protein [Verrucomicrobiales bacterium]|nr:type secretion system protein [Verrucomicrobiales bacterium]
MKIRGLKGAAFSLVELLVTIAIIGVLAALVTSGLGRAKSAGRATVCRNNLRQTYFALALYVSDFRAYPPAQAVFDLVVHREGIDLHPLIWYGALGVYSGIDPRIFVCPQEVTFLRPGLSMSGSDGKPHSVLPAQMMTAFLNYGYNATGSGIFGAGSNLGLGEGQGDRRAVGEQLVLNPSDMIAFGDGKGLVISPVQADENPPERHNSKASLGFCDGHVETQTPRKWCEKSETARSRWNNDHLPHL